MRYLLTLLLLIAATLPAQADTLTPEEAARAKKLRQVRMQYAASENYNPQASVTKDTQAINTLINQRKYDEAQRALATLMAKNPAIPELYQTAARLLRAQRKVDQSETVAKVSTDIQNSIFLDADGRSPETAFTIIRPSEISIVANKLGLRKVDQKTETKNGHTYYRVSMKDKLINVAGTTPQEYYFNVDAIAEWEKKHPELAKKSSVRIGTATVVSDGDDSGPRLISTTGGGGGSGNKWTSFADLQKAAEEQNAEALNELGQMYLRGTPDTPKNITRALLYFEDAARLGNTPANFRLGKLYSDGTETPQDYVKARTHYTAAARAGDPIAQHNLGAMISSGRGAQRDYPEGLAWLILAAKKNPDAAESEKKLRTFLAKRPDWIAAGEKRAEELTQELSAPQPAKPAAEPLKPSAPKMEVPPLQVTPMEIAPPPSLIEDQYIG